MKNYLILIFLILYINCQADPNQQNEEDISDSDDEAEAITFRCSYLIIITKNILG